MVFLELEFDLPKRPDETGEQGRPITLTSNFYEVRNFAQQMIHYDVEISEGKRRDKFPKDLNLSVIEELVRLNRHIFQERPVYDGSKSLYSKDELDLESKVSVNNTLINVHIILKKRGWKKYLYSLL